MFFIKKQALRKSVAFFSPMQNMHEAIFFAGLQHPTQQKCPAKKQGNY